MKKDQRWVTILIAIITVTFVLLACHHNDSSSDTDTELSYSFSDYWSPWVTKTSTDTATINWRGKSDASGLVHYDTTDHYTNFNNELRCKISSSNDNRYQHVKIDGLQAGTEYTYQVKLDDGHRFSTRSFRTMPASGPFKFIVISDPQGGHHYDQEKRFKYVADAIAKEKDVLFVLCGGDYNRFDTQEGWCRFFQVADPMLSKIAIFPTIGNHEYHQDGGSQPTGADHYRWSFDAPPLYYSFDCANVRFCVLASPDPNAAHKDDPQTSKAYTESQADWLKSKLDDNSLAGKFTIQHNPIWGAGSTEKDGNLALWEEYFHQFNISANFAGHRHNYQRLTVGGIPYFIVGTAGGPCSDVSEPYPDGFEFGESRYLGYLTVTVDPEAGTARAEQYDVANVGEDDSKETPNTDHPPPHTADTVDFSLR
jgi:hypothetical protein